MHMKTFNIPPFRPHVLLRNPHIQTLYASVFPGRRSQYEAVRHTVAIDPKNSVVLHDDTPQQWSTGDLIAVLVHGLAGCHQSGYMARIASKLTAVGVRVFRMDLRNCGSGVGLAQMPYHAGRSEDVLAVLDYLAGRFPESSIKLAGFSLGGNITLKLMGQHAADLPQQLRSAIAVCPSLDLSSCVRSIERPSMKLYDRYFLKLLRKQVQQVRQVNPLAPAWGADRPPRSIWDFDNLYTGPVCGFETADKYYKACSAAQFVDAIQCPTLILAAGDDPLVPRQIFENLPRNDAVQVHVTDHGGHLGFVGQARGDADNRWMDWRVVDWMTHQNF